jgi:exonuclease SbcD
MKLQRLKVEHLAGIDRPFELGDLDASGGTYAPFTSRELTDAGLDAWLLGHIHKPSLTEGGGPDGSGPRGYLGSLVGLDPGEMGPHGPWLVRVNSRGEVATQQLVMAPLRWERFEVRVEEEERPEDLADRLLAEMARVGIEIQALQTLQPRGSVPKVLGLRPRLVGQTRHYDDLRRYIDEGRWNGLLRSAGETLVFIDKVLDGLDLAHDLTDLARGDDPPALMARKLLILRRPGADEERSALLEATRQTLQGLANEARWASLDEGRDQQDPLSDSALASILVKAGTDALCELLSQRDAEAGVDS